MIICTIGLMLKDKFLLKNNVHIIGITGGSGSGKTFLCNKLIKKFGSKHLLKIEVDSYYNNLSHLSMQEREKTNFDHPNAFDFELLHQDLNKIKKLQHINIPIYDYKTHTRKLEFNHINKIYDIILLEGIFSLYSKDIRNMLTASIFVDIPNNIRKKRRISRDIKDRKRTIESIKKQYISTVEPMYTQYIKPTKKHSNIIIKDISKSDKGYIKLLEIISRLII